MVKLLLVCLAVCVAATSATKCETLQGILDGIFGKENRLNLDHFKGLRLRCGAIDNKLNEKGTMLTLTFTKDFDGKYLHAKGEREDQDKSPDCLQYEPLDTCGYIVEMKGYQGNSKAYRVIHYYDPVHRITYTQSCTAEDSPRDDDFNAAWYDCSDENPPTSKQIQDFVEKGNPNANVKYFG